ncbi:MAG TPA: response regulator [Gemmatimonadaceae bacterium]|nr:response regulator [Gemmatimonadaceae bacterium]
MAAVLYVDDEEAIRRALQSWLTRRGHVVYTAATSDEAREILTSHEVDGAFIDIWLGDESGFDLFEWIDMHKPRVAEHVVFVTGDIIREGEVEKSLIALERPVLAKPFELGELERIVASWSPG